MWVLNGRAAAPPCMTWSIGVSISMKSCAAKVRRSEAITSARVRMVSRADSRVMRSR